MKRKKNNIVFVSDTFASDQPLDRTAWSATTGFLQKRIGPVRRIVCHNPRPFDKETSALVLHTTGYEAKEQQLIAAAQKAGIPTLVIYQGVMMPKNIYTADRQVQMPVRPSKLLQVLSEMLG